MTEESYSSIDDAIDFYKTEVSVLAKSIMSSDISLVEIVVSSPTIKEYCAQLRSVTTVISRKHSLNTFIEVPKEPVYLKDFLIRGIDNDLTSSLQSFFDLSKNFLTAYKGVKPNDVNYRLASALVANVIHVKEQLAGIIDVDIYE